MTYERLVETAYEDWENQPEIAKACENIIEKIRVMDSEDFRHLTFHSIHRLSESNLDRYDIIKLTQYLCGDRIRLFKVGFEYIGASESFILDIDNSYYAQNENIIAHPVSGELIYNAKDFVFMFFSLYEENINV